MTLREHIDFLIAKYGSLRAAARKTGVDATYLCRLKSGENTNPSDDMLRRLGLVRKVEYIRIGDT